MVDIAHANAYSEVIEILKSIIEKYSIYSDSDHLVPFELLEQYCKDINSIAIPMKDIGHMGKKSGLEELPEVIKLIIICKKHNNKSFNMIIIPVF